MLKQQNDTLVCYLSQIGQYEQLTEEDEQTASKLELVLHNLKLAVHIAKSYARNSDELLDRIQDANLGLMQAAENYDSTRGKFSVCASYYIRASIRNKLTDNYGKSLRKRTTYDVAVDIDDLAHILSVNSEDFNKLCLSRACRYITQKQKKAIKLRLEGYTHQEIASVLKTTYQNVQQLERLAIKTLAKIH